MGLNDIRLSAGTIAALYQDTLIEPTPRAKSVKTIPTPVPEVVSEKPLKKAPAKTELPFLGSNARQILILVNYPTVSFLPDDELEFLTKMLLACKLSIADVAIVNKGTNAEATYALLSKQLKPKTVFLFGISPIEFGLPLDFPLYQVQAHAGVTFLYSQPLEDRHKDDLLKSKLWISLKKIFGL